MRELRVALRFDLQTELPVGTLAELHGQVYFEFDSSFRLSGLELSPLRLPLSTPGMHEHRQKRGVPLPGVFNDARPDGWGLRLLHRAFQSRGRTAGSVSALEELAFLGAHTMGALVFAPATGPDAVLSEAVELAALARHAQRLWDDAVEEVLPQLLRAAGPSGGARPKALIGLPADGGPGCQLGEGELLPGWEAWLVKFPTRTDDPDAGRREHAWLRMAASAGLVVPPSRVLSLDELSPAFAVRRFDRPGDNRRLHMLSAAGALDVDFRTASTDYEQLIRVALALSQHDQSQAEAVFRLAAFNVAAVNEDDHLKNIAWLMDRDGTWRLSPHYDLTYAPHSSGQRWTTVAGHGHDIDRSALLELAQRSGLRQRRAAAILDEVLAATHRVREILREHHCHHGVSDRAAEAVLAASERLG